ncbi:MAG: class I SAM-dependent methyltransferase [Rhodothermales bacterium]|nr:class I SAM-dependent methyltransferase [Rhodothermales bacterium]
MSDDYVLAPPYSVLARGYDLVMEHVDYAEWADYVHELLQKHGTGSVKTILELGCGTGAFAGQLQPQGPYRYTATDVSEAMLTEARDLLDDDGDIRFEHADFREFQISEPVDAALLLYDGLNYLVTDDDVHALFDAVSAALKPGGLFLFDQSTPANSINNAAYFEDEGEEEGFAYVRRSAYDPATRLHTTTFEMETPEGRFRENHVEKAYTLDEVRALVSERFAVVAAYDGFTFKPATEASERIHWVVRK